MQTQSHDSSPRFDFDRWSELANRDPDAFEAKRAAVIEAAITRASTRSQARLRRLQWKLDQVRRTSATPLAAAIRMNELMWERITGRGGLLQALTEGPATPAAGGDCAVLSFPGRN